MLTTAVMQCRLWKKPKRCLELTSRCTCTKACVDIGPVLTKLCYYAQQSSKYSYWDHFATNILCNLHWIPIKCDKVSVVQYASTFWIQEIRILSIIRCPQAGYLCTSCSSGLQSC